MAREKGEHEKGQLGMLRYVGEGEQRKGKTS